jgi:hypothetical protein
VPSAARPAVRRFVRHLQAFLDPRDAELAWRAAPDLFFARLPALTAERRAACAARVAAGQGAPERV